MATDDNELSRQARFEKYNPYAPLVRNTEYNDSRRAQDALLAVAFEISQLRTEIHFQSKGRSS